MSEKETNNCIPVRFNYPYKFPVLCSSEITTISANDIDNIAKKQRIQGNYIYDYSDYLTQKVPQVNRKAKVSLVSQVAQNIILLDSIWHYGRKFLNGELDNKYLPEALNFCNPSIVAVMCLFAVEQLLPPKRYIASDDNISLEESTNIVFNLQQKVFAYLSTEAMITPIELNSEFNALREQYQLNHQNMLNKTMEERKEYAKSLESQIGNQLHQKQNRFIITYSRYYLRKLEQENSGNFELLYQIYTEDVIKQKYFTRLTIYADDFYNDHRKNFFEMLGLIMIEKVHLENTDALTKASEQDKEKVINENQERINNVEKTIEVIKTKIIDTRDLLRKEQIAKLSTSDKKALTLPYFLKHQKQK